MGLPTIIRKEKVRQGEYRILILGLDNAGKSTVLNRWLNPPGAPITICPTFGFEIKSLQLSPEKCLNFWDIGGQKSIRPFWRNYYEETDAVVWVIDSIDRDRLADCRRELEIILNSNRLAGASLLILANKQDSPGAMSLEHIRDALGLARLNEYHHHWAVFGTSAMNGTNIAESLKWLGEEFTTGRYPGNFNMELNTNTTATATINTEEGENVNNIEFVEEEVEEENENLTVNDVVIDKKAVQLMHSCPIWVKMSEIPHPALVPGFISRRECLQDGSLDPTTSSVPTQVSLLSASTLSPSLIQVVSNIPTGLMLESVHKRNLKDELREEMVPCVLGSYTPAHYVRTSDPTLLTAVSSSSSSASNTHVSVAQTAAELSAMNILYGGVKGKAYLESLEDFVDGISLPENDSTIRPIIMSKLEGIRSACGYKILNMDDDKKVPFNITEVNQIISSTTPDVESFDSLTRENDSILTILGRSASVDEVNRTALLERLGVNLRALIKLCPDEIRNGELFKGVDMNLDKYNLSKKLIN